MSKTIHEIVAAHLDAVTNHDVILLKDVVVTKVIEALESVDRLHGDMIDEILANIDTMTPECSGNDFILYERPKEIVILHNAEAGATAINLNIDAGKDLYEFLTQRGDEVVRLLERMKSEPIGFQLGSDEDNPIVKQFFFVTSIHAYVQSFGNLSQEHRPEGDYAAMVRLTTTRHGQ